LLLLLLLLFGICLIKVSRFFCCWSFTWNDDNDVDCCRFFWLRSKTEVRPCGTWSFLMFSRLFTMRFSDNHIEVVKMSFREKTSTRKSSVINANVCWRLLLLVDVSSIFHVDSFINWKKKRISYLLHWMHEFKTMRLLW
jgi:L-asparagine transporter-like permease